jgi:hypothetical protein
MRCSCSINCVVSPSLLMARFRVPFAFASRLLAPTARERGSEPTITVFIGNSCQVYRRDGILHQISYRHASDFYHHPNHLDTTCRTSLRSLVPQHSKSAQAQHSYDYWDPTCLHSRLLGRADIFHQSKETWDLRCRCCVSSLGLANVLFLISASIRIK